MKTLKLMLVVLLFAAMISGCTTTSAGLAPSSTPLAGREYTVVGDAKGSGWGAFLLAIPLSESNPTRAGRERAMASLNADGLIDVSVDQKIYNFGVVLLQRTIVTGKAIKFN